MKIIKTYGSASSDESCRSVETVSTPNMKIRILELALNVTGEINIISLYRNNFSSTGLKNVTNRRNAVNLVHHPDFDIESYSSLTSWSDGIRERNKIILKTALQKHKIKREKLRCNIEQSKSSSNECLIIS